MVNFTADLSKYVRSFSVAGDHQTRVDVVEAGALQLHATVIICIQGEHATQVTWLSSRGPQCSALSGVARGESTRTVAPRISCFCIYLAPPCVCFWKKWRFAKTDENRTKTPILLQLKTFQKSKCAHHPHTRCHLCAKFDALRPSESWDIVRVEKKQSPTQTDRHPAPH